MSNFYKTFTLLLLTIVIPALLIGQNQQQQNSAAMQPVIYNKVLKTGFEPLETAFVPSPYHPSSQANARTEAEITIGETVYDLQSNSTGCKRISMRPDGRIIATWTMGFDDINTYPNRGTGYNQRLDYVWGEVPEEGDRLESERVGWPNHVFTADGAEVVVSHTSNNELKVLRRSNETEAWVETAVTSAVTGGNLWPRAAVGGADGQSIHVVAITAPSTLDGTVYEGLDGHILYHRSTDGGASWDQVDVILPGWGSTNTGNHSADSYYIDARGDNVAIGVFSDWDDVVVFKSDDNGDTWTKHIVNDFPLDGYAIDAGYTFADLPQILEDDQPDSLAIFSSDGYGTVLIDNNGMAHTFFGRMWIQDDDLLDGNSSYYPTTDGIVYWNETFGADSSSFVVGTVDQNLNDTLDIVATADISLYFSSLTTMPSAGVDDLGNLYMAYSGVIEGALSPGDAQHFRHIYIVTSPDNGETWSEPFDINVPDLAIEPDLVDFIEGVFPSIVRDVDSDVRLIYMQDYQPGLSVRGDEDDASLNFINYIPISVSEFGITSTEELVAPEAFALKVFPTVTRTQVTVQFDLEDAGQVQMDLVNMHGQLVQNVWSGDLQAGAQQQIVDLSHLNTATYYLLIRTNNKYAAVPVMKQ